MKSLEEYKAEILRLHVFTMRLAEHLAAASEVLSKLAERSDVRLIDARTPNPHNEGTMKHVAAWPII